METLLPSEIARLVLVREHVNKITDCEQLKHCGDVLEQLRFLIEETRGQRFVVNINVPSQNSTQSSSSSPMLSGNIRKRHHSNSDRERCKRPKLVSSSSQPQMLSSTDVAAFDNLEVTPLKSLPGYMDIFERSRSVSESKKSTSNNSLQQDDVPDVGNVTENVCTGNSVKDSDVPARCTAATNTEELLNYSCVEVQTSPYDTPESGSETNDEPIENLSLLTKELLNRTELQERIAENINKAILPTDTSLKEDAMVNGEANTSVVTELNNAIKSIVEETESDPIFEKFLDEIIGPHIRTDTSPSVVDDSDSKPKSPIESKEKQPETISNTDNLSERGPSVLDSKQSAERMATVPLKHRLRSSSKQQNVRNEDEQRDQERDCTALEDINAAAILSIINANSINNKLTNEKKLEDCTKETVSADIHSSLIQIENRLPALQDPHQNKDEQSKKIMIEVDRKEDANVVKKVESVETGSKVRKTYMKRAQYPVKPVQASEEITVPTLVLAPKSVVLPMSSFMPVSSSRLVPIAPKDPNMPDRSLMDKMYLTTVNVAQKVSPFVHNHPIVTPESLISCMITMASTTTTKTLTSTTMEMCQQNNDKASSDKGTSASIRTENFAGSSVTNSTTFSKSINGELITLYGNENNAKTLLDGANVPSINIEDNISISGSGLSPYLKFNCSKSNQNQSLSDIDLTPAAPVTEVAAPVTGNDVKTKSSSTPRRKDSHIRALDFNTPIKTSDEAINEIGFSHSSSKISSTTHVKSVCASLFKSPPFSNVTVSMHKLPCTLPVPAKSSVVKLTGDCGKQNGLDTIAIDVPACSNNNVPTENKDSKVKPRVSSMKLSKPTWDADLRMALTAADNKIVQQKKTSGNNTTIDPASTTKLNTIGTVKKNKSNACVSKVKDLVSKKGSSTVGSTAPEKKLEENNIPDTRKNDNTQLSNKDVNEEKDANDKLPMAKKVTDTLPQEKKIVKKYAQIKTLKTNLKKKDSKPQTDNKSCGKDEGFSIKTLTSSDIDQQLLQLSNLNELGTPAKSENPIELPPTPRLLSPTSNITIPYTKSNEDLSKVRSFISTPEFPTTPGINLTMTPKISDEITVDDVKNQELHSCSPYYKPTSEKGESFEKSLKLNSNNDTKQPTTSTYGVCAPTKLEITQFEVIKENLPKEQAIKELKIAASNSRESMQHHTGQEAKFVHDGEPDMNMNKHTIKEDDKKYSSNSDESNENMNVSNTSSSSCSSSCSSSSNSSSSSTSSSSSQLSSSKSQPPTTSKATNFLDKCSLDKKCNKSWNQTYTDTNDDFTVTRIAKINEKTKCLETQTVPDDHLKKHESSPLKTFPITENEKDLKSHTKETPVKDETLLNEIDILETPNSSKSGMDNITNLASKISALISSENEKLPKVTNSPHIENASKNVKEKVKIRSIERVTSAPLVILKPLNIVTSSPSSKSNHKPVAMDEKLVLRLEAKRQRVITKFREVSKTNLAKKKTQTRRILSKAKNAVNLKKETGLKSALKNASTLNSKKDTKIAELNSNNNHDKSEHINVTNDVIANSNSNNNAVSTNNMNKDNRIFLKKEDEEEHNYYRKEEDSLKPKNTVDANGRTKLLESKSKPAKRNVLIKEQEKRRMSNDTELLAEQRPNNNIPDKVERQRDSENGKNLSHVLQCLELVPTCKSDNVKESQSVKSDQKLDLNNVQYHFVYDDKVSFKKRRRRYNSDELKVEVHFAGCNDGVKVLSASDYEEIFDLQPILKKRNSETSHKMFADSSSVTKNIQPKPLATSSPLDKPTAVACKVKKVTFPNSEKDKEKDVTQRDVKKRSKPDKTQKIDADKAPKFTKIPKRKVSQAKESKQMDKQLCTADPQALLSNLDLDKFLNSVHGSA
ncbi:ras guanine nucleotide exchange factor P-like isoform X2 [Ceratina calcarata]|uniref:Ras guanine nucleotide exchange factor P-like isoform X2 n=1 Tax=Ceratina calcarata TaxID=156304 RepID=A0AAJ7W9D0_9HYME|nr:ras guanine nucleotide exchange factor P-like isoform X2 [Ceratina calcarata]